MGSLVQFVCYSTVQPQSEFMVAWESFAGGFLSRGIERIVLAENVDRTSEAAFDFVSRNLWDEGRFERAFPHGVRGTGGLGSIVVLQAGGFRLAEAVNMDIADGPREETKVMAFFMARTGQRDAARIAIRSALRMPGVVATASYLKDGDARTDRFDVVVEVFCTAESAPEVIERIGTACAPFLLSGKPAVIGAYQECAELAVAVKRA